MDVAAGENLRAVRWVAASTGAVGALPLLVALIELSTDTHKVEDVAFTIFLILAGPLPVPVTAFRLGVGARYAGGVHLATLTLAGIMNVFAMGFAAMGATRGSGWLFVGELFFLASFASTVTAMIMGRRGAREGARRAG